MTREAAAVEITRRLVDYYRPVKIYLFGSAARGGDGVDSDLDFLVVVPDETPDEKLAAGAAVGGGDAKTLRSRGGFGG